MKRLFFSLAVLAIFCCCSNQDNQESTGKQVYYNALVYTADKEHPEATAFVVEGDKIVYVGNDSAAIEFAGKEAKTIDMNKKRVIPGLSDTHCHYLMLCSLVSKIPSIQLDQHETHEQTIARIKAFAEKYSEEQVPVIYGFGWGFKCKAHKKEIDTLGITRPVLILSCDGHTGWINTPGLKKLGVDKDYKDIAPGVSYFERDANNEPTGKIVETTQEFWATQNIGLFTPDVIYSGMRNKTAEYNSLGVTSLYDAGSLVYTDEMALKAAKMYTDNTIRLYTSIVFNGLEGEDDFISRAKTLRENYSSSIVHPTTIKSFKDGTKEEFTAYVYRPYPNGSYGNCLFSTEKHLSVMSKAAAEGFNIHIHAIGDRAINETLDVMAGLGTIKGTKTIAHNEIVCDEALNKYKNNTDVFYQTTPVWWESVITMKDLQATGFDKDWADYYIQHRYPIRSVKDAGVTVTFGSDAPASDGINPMREISAAVNRHLQTDFGETVDQRFTVAECLDACTINAARQYGAENEFGSITTGKYADFVVLDKDILAVPTDEIKDIKVIATYFGGKQVYGN